MKHKAFSFNNPNRMRSLAGSFAAFNPTQFNAQDGSGYDFIAKIVLDLDAKNPQVAARLLRPSKAGARSRPNAGPLPNGSLRRVASTAVLSADVKDIAERSLG